jgi:hypothetical protein
MLSRIGPVRRLLGGIVCCSVALAVGGATAVAGTVPPVEKARIHAILSPYDFYPASLPKGLIYISFKQTALTPSVCGINVTIQFAAAGDREIDWSSSRDCDGQGRVNCNATGYPGYAFGMTFNRKTAVINHRRVWFSMGNHGSNAWMCIPLRVSGYTDWAAVGIWESNFISPAQAMRLVAYAHR